MECGFCLVKFKTTNNRKKFCCKECQCKDDNRKRRNKNKEKLKIFNKKCKNCENIFIFSTDRPTQKYCSKDCKNNIAVRKYYSDNKNKEKIRKNKYYKENKHSYVQRTAKRRVAKLRATLNGFTKEIKEIYKKCPKGYHVDHIIPLQGKTCCGLHVPWNLQYLTPEANLKKSNKLILDYIV